MKARRQQPTDVSSAIRELPDSVEFCTNCDDIEDMAVTDEPQHPDDIRKRFSNCEHTGKFQGDICSRLYIAAQEDDPGPLFEDE